MVDFLPTIGVLPAGLHNYRTEEFIEQFVTSFKTSSTRVKILDGAKIFISSICRHVTPCEMWFDGSFVTTKVNPNDIDLVLFFNKDDIDRKWNMIEPILYKSKALYCDAYVAIVGDEIKRSYWRGWFTYDRLENPKGAIKVNPSEFVQSIYEVVRNVK